MPWPPKGDFVYRPLMRALTEKATRMASHPLPIGFAQGRAVMTVAQRLPFPSMQFDAVITSPPFYRNRDFLRMNRIRLWFCGWDYAHQEKMKSEFLEHKVDIGSYAPVFREANRVLRPGGACVLHLGVVGNFDMAEQLKPYAAKEGFEACATVYEDTSDLESHGVVDRGATHTHQFLVLRKAMS